MFGVHNALSVHSATIHHTAHRYTQNSPPRGPAAKVLAGTSLAHPIALRICKFYSLIVLWIGLCVFVEQFICRYIFIRRWCDCEAHPAMLNVFTIYSLCVYWYGLRYKYIWWESIILSSCLGQQLNIQWNG